MHITNVAGGSHKLREEVAEVEAEVAEAVLEVVLAEGVLQEEAGVDHPEVVVVVVALGAEEGFRTLSSATSDLVRLCFRLKMQCAHNNQNLNCDINIEFWLLMTIFCFIFIPSPSLTS